MQCLVIGNGESRRSLDLSSVKTTTYGCNAIHRDLIVDHLICVDSRMVVEALENPNINKSVIYTRKNWITQFSNFKNVKLVPWLPYQGTLRMDDPWHWGSGPYAVLLAATNHDEIDLIGFDLYSENGLVNNVYKDTKNYLASTKPKVDPSYWVYQISRVFECNPKKTFKIYNDGKWQLPREWNLPNVSKENLQDLANFINSSV